MPPSAAATPGSARTFVSSDSGNDGNATWLLLFPPMALFALITASVFE